MKVELLGQGRGKSKHLDGEPTFCLPFRPEDIY